MATSPTDPRRDHGFHQLVVKGIIHETADTRSFVLDVPAELRELFAYRPGQFCTFRVRLGDDELLRCYSMSSAPETDADLTVTVKRVPDGRVSNWFNDEVTEGDALDVTKPAGHFCIRDHQRPVVSFAGGSGVTPVMSITKSVLATSERPVRMLFANRDRDSVIFGDQLDALSVRFPDRLDVRRHFDAESGYLDADAIVGFVDDDHDADFYLCGPTPFMDLVEDTLLGLDIDPDQILVERFVNDGRPAPGIDEPTIEAGATDAVETESVTIILNGKATTIDYRSGDTVLNTARTGGLQPPFSCQAGDCATCMALVHEGSARMRVNNALTPEEVDEGWILTCQALPQSPAITVEYES